MAPITWRNVAPPDLNGTAYGSALAGQSINGAFNGLTQLMEAQQKVDDSNWNNQANINTENIATQAKAIQDLKGYYTGKDSFDPTVIAGTDVGRQYHPEQVQSALAARLTALRNEAIGQASTAGLTAAGVNGSAAEGTDAFIKALQAAGEQDQSHINTAAAGFTKDTLVPWKALDAEKTNAGMNQQTLDQQARLQGVAPAVTPTTTGVPTTQNNIGNIRVPGSTTEFQKFGSPEEGVAAIDRQLGIYGSKHGINTLADTISRWSPPNENKTADLIAAASKVTGFAPDQKIDLTDPVVQASVRQAIIKQEGKGGNTLITPAATQAGIGTTGGPGTANGAPVNPALIGGIQPTPTAIPSELEMVTEAIKRVGVNRFTPEMRQQIKETHAQLASNRSTELAATNDQLGSEQKLRERAITLQSGQLADQAVAAFRDRNNPAFGDVDKARNLIPEGEFADSARKNFDGRMETLTKPSAQTVTDDKILNENLGRAFKSTDDQYARAIANTTTNMGSYAPEKGVTDLVEKAKDHPNGFGGVLTDLTDIAGTKTSGDLLHKNVLINRMVQRRDDMVKAGVDPTIAATIIFDALHQGGAIQKSFWDNLKGVDEGVLAKHIPDAIDRAVKYGTHQGLVSDLETQRAASQTRDAELLQLAQSSLLKGRTAAVAGGDKFNLGTYHPELQANIDLRLAESRKPPEVPKAVNLKNKEIIDALTKYRDSKEAKKAAEETLKATTAAQASADIIKKRDGYPFTGFGY